MTASKDRCRLGPASHGLGMRLRQLEESQGAKSVPWPWTHWGQIPGCAAARYSPVSQGGHKGTTPGSLLAVCWGGGGLFGGRADKSRMTNYLQESLEKGGWRPSGGVNWAAKRP